jgi:titin
MAASVSGTRVTLSWQAPTTGAAPSTYVVDVGTTSGGSDVTRDNNVGNVLSVAGDLDRGTYYARVRAANNAGVSASSNEVRFLVGRKLRTPSSLAVNWTGTTATLSWAPPAADGVDEAATSYVIEAGTSPGASNVGSVNVGNTTTYQANVPAGTYYVRVRALNAVGESDPSDDVEVRAPGAPHAPTELVSSGTSGEVSLSWSAPRGGPPPAGYVIEAGSAPGLTDLASLSVGNVTSFTTTAPPGLYYVRVRAANDRGSSAPSNEVVVQR